MSFIGEETILRRDGKKYQVVDETDDGEIVAVLPCDRSYNPIADWINIDETDLLD